MNTKSETSTQTKRVYTKPEIQSIQIDNQISMVMMSPCDEPGGGCGGENNMNTINNPYKITKA